MKLFDKLSPSQIAFRNLLSAFEGISIENIDPKKDDMSIFNILSAIGFLRRGGTSAENLRTVRLIEVDLRHNIEKVVDAYSEHMVTYVIPVIRELVEKLIKNQINDFSDTISKYFTLRDFAGLSLKLIEEYINEEYCEELYPNGIPENWKSIGEINKYLNKEDWKIVLRVGLVKYLWSIGEKILTYDPYYWWVQDFRHPDDGIVCYIPEDFKIHAIVNYKDGSMEKELADLYKIHLIVCDECKKAVEEKDEF